MKITAELEFNESVDAPSLGNQIINSAAEKLIKSKDRNLHEEVMALVTENIRGTVNDAVKKILQDPVQLTDCYGSPKGEPKTIREMIMERADNWLRDKVDDYGRRSHDRDTVPRINQMIDKLIKDWWTKFSKKTKDEFTMAVEKNMDKEVRKAMGRIVGK